MKQFLYLLVTVFIGSGYGRHLEEVQHEHVLKRFVRQTNDAYAVQLEAIILHECELNNHGELEYELQKSISEMQRCFKRVELFSVSKEEFLRHMDLCSEDTIIKTKKCLNEKQKYFPKLLLDLAKSLVGFLYDDIFFLPEVGRCRSRLNQLSAQAKYHQCLLTASENTNDQQSVPENKNDFCRSFVEALECFPKHLKEYCEETPNMNTFTRDYSNALKRPCENVDVE